MLQLWFLYPTALEGKKKTPTSSQSAMTNVDFILNSCMGDICMLISLLPEWLNFKAHLSFYLQLNETSK